MSTPVIDSDGDISLEDDESTLSLSMSGIDDEEHDADKSSALVDLVSSIQPKFTEQSAPRERSHGAQESSAPSDFGFNPKRKLTVADLLPTVSNSDPRLRKSLKLLNSQASTTSSRRNGIPAKLEVPLPKRQQGRLDRAAAYQKSKETLDRWIDTVKHNRRAEHLSFPLIDSTAAGVQGVNRLLPTSHSQPLNDLESAINSILHDSGLSSSHGKSQEDQIQTFEELQTNKMSLDEVQTRRAELRKARELLFREEVRAKRIKKIKSKSYRRVHRKQRERAEQGERAAFAAAGVQLSEDEHERDDRRRAEERMGARHRESKWAKGVKDSGRVAWDEDARTGVTEMAKRGEELRRRIEGKEVRDEDEVGSDSISESSDSGDDNTGIVLESVAEGQKLRRKLDLLDGGATVHASNGMPRTNLSSMKFMQKAEFALKQQNDADAKRLHRDLIGEEALNDNEEEPDSVGRRKFGPNSRGSTQTAKIAKLTRSEFEEGAHSDGQDEADAGMHVEDDVEVVTDKPPRSTTLHISKRKRNPLQGDPLDEQAADVVRNPWLAAPVKKSRSQQSRNIDSDRVVIGQETNSKSLLSHTVPNQRSGSPAHKSQERASRMMNVTNSWQSVSNVPLVHADESGDSDKASEDMRRLPVIMRNQELVKKAFAGDEVVADFEQEKQDTAQDQDEKVVDLTLPGWGSWTGAGISKKEQKRNKGRFLTKEEGIKKQNRKDLKLDRVIMNEKRVKKNVKYLASQLPHPFETRQQYERSLRLPVGPEWTTKETFQTATKPRIMVKQGVITPMENPII
ncbi:MAG: hypothetical protein M1830_003097 [Pleopsidium flavum]|nr:MAG: hypothetical protein M1830_003097 [Pleopsidium flavum]